MNFSKPVLKINEQIDLLESRGMVFYDKERAAKYLENINYYRFSAYSFPFRIKDNSTQRFVESISFEKILNIYLFDRKLKLLVFDVIERIEVALRTQIIYQFSLDYKPYFFQDQNLFSNIKFFQKNLKTLDKEINRSFETFINHYKNKYSTPERPPSWMSLEITSMGLLSMIYGNLRNCDAKKKVAFHFGLTHPRILESWIHSISYVRNIVAHHSRLWNRKLTVTAIKPKRTMFQWVENNQYNSHSVYAFLINILYLVKRINPNSNFSKKFRNLLEKYKNDIDLRNMGFPSNWEKEELRKI